MRLAEALCHLCLLETFWARGSITTSAAAPWSPGTGGRRVPWCPGNWTGRQREDYNNTIESEYISIYFMQDISEPRGGMTLLAR